MYYNMHGSKKYRDQPERKAELFGGWEAEKEKKKKRSNDTNYWLANIIINIVLRTIIQK